MDERAALRPAIATRARAHPVPRRLPRPLRHAAPSSWYMSAAPPLSPSSSPVHVTLCSLARITRHLLLLLGLPDTFFSPARITRHLLLPLGFPGTGCQTRVIAGCRWAVGGLGLIASRRTRGGFEGLGDRGAEGSGPRKQGVGYPPLQICLLCRLSPLQMSPLRRWDRTYPPPHPEVGKHEGYCGQVSKKLRWTYALPWGFWI
ncbi:hypothetical protein B0T17DRAFT_136192 [Bombardia bombarda]|uniref:Uncharacterized protein n=1 Tax=Bombardia bombarda TaxID=252184 RepID=A0AA39WA20_9PEZI|nr:hypothetical protein B0T17DRAFT_136192 [Bombardia bombarda]